MVESFIVYKDALQDGHTLEVFLKDEMVFSSSGRWLHPLFQLENAVADRYDCAELFLHDSISGIAAATITIYLGIGHVMADMMSEGALEMYRAHDVDAHYGTLVPEIKCITESMINPSDDIPLSYRKLRQKANLTSGMRLEVSHLSFSYDKKRKILDDLSFILNPGDTVILEGENGSGKTTLLRCILSLLEPDSGSVLFDGEPGPRDIAYIKQHDQAVPFPLTAGEVVSLAIDDRKDAEELSELSMRRTGCYELKDRNYFTLSGGEKQKVNLARALAGRARLMILDEPTASLDKEAKKAFVSILSSLGFAEMPTILLVSHDMYVNDSLGWPRIRMEGGNIG